MTGQGEDKVSETAGGDVVTLLQLEDGMGCLCWLGRFRGSTGMRLYLESNYPYNRLDRQTLTPDVLDDPQLALLGARDMKALAALLKDLRETVPQPPIVVAMVDDYSEDDVLDLMNEGVTSVITDYVDLVNVRATLGSAVRQARLLHEQRLALKDVEATAQSALQTVSEFGMLLHFLQQSNVTADVAALLEVTVAFLRNMGLQGCVQVQVGNSKNHASTEGEASSVQLALLESMTDRVVQRGRILGLVGTSCVWVCSSPQLTDEAFSGRMRDILIQAVDILDARVRGLEMVELIRQQYGQVFDVIQLMQNSLRDSQAATQYIMKRLALDIEQCAVSLDLSEHQEAALLSLSNKALDQMDRLFTGFGLLERHLMSVLSGLEKARDLADASTSGGDGSGAGESVELF